MVCCAYADESRGSRCVKSRSESGSVSDEMAEAEAGGRRDDYIWCASGLTSALSGSILMGTGDGQINAWINQYIILIIGRQQRLSVMPDFCVCCLLETTTIRRETLLASARVAFACRGFCC